MSERKELTKKQRDVIVYVLFSAVMLFSLTFIALAIENGWVFGAPKGTVTPGSTHFAASLNILDLPDTINDYFFGGTNLFAAQLLITLIVVFMFMLPMMLLRASFGTMFIVLFLLLGVLTAVGWVNPVLFIVLLLMTSLMFSRQIAEIFSSGGR